MISLQIIWIERCFSWVWAMTTSSNTDIQPSCYIWWIISLVSTSESSPLFMLHLVQAGKYQMRDGATRPHVLGVRPRIYKEIPWERCLNVAMRSLPQSRNDFAVHYPYSVLTRAFLCKLVDLVLDPSPRRGLAAVTTSVGTFPISCLSCRVTSSHICSRRP